MDNLRLGKLSQKIMNVLWFKRSANVEEVKDSLPGKKDLAYTTISTILNRLFRRGLLKRKLKGKAYLYRPSLSSKTYEKRLAKQTISGLIKNSSEPQVIISQFVEEIGKIDKEKLKELADFLNQGKHIVKKKD